MGPLPDILDTLGNMPIENILGLIALAAVALAAFAIHTIGTLAKNRDKK